MTKISIALAILIGFLSGFLLAVIILDNVHKTARFITPEQLDCMNGEASFVYWKFENAKANAWNLPVSWKCVTGTIIYVDENLHNEWESFAPDAAAPQQFLWNCHQVVMCSQVDWSSTHPEDACTYKDTKEFSSVNPANYPSYGAHCELAE